MFPRLELTLNRAKSARSGIWSVGKQREWTWGCNISENFSITSCFSLHTEICLLSLQSCLILLLLGNCERQLLAKSYSGTKSRPVMQHHQQIGSVCWKGWNAVQNYPWGPGGISDATSVSGRVVEGFSRNCTNNVLYFNIQIAHWNIVYINVLVVEGFSRGCGVPLESVLKPRKSFPLDQPCPLGLRDAVLWHQHHRCRHHYYHHNHHHHHKQISLLCSFSFVMEHKKWKSKYR